MNQAYDETHGTPERTQEVHDVVLGELRRNFHLVPVAAVGQRSDPRIHDAITMEPSDRPRGTIVEVHAQGYREEATGRLVRPALVVVSEGPREPNTVLN
jgi:molecular chaperone GrpE